jgi:hypothetical protein
VDLKEHPAIIRKRRIVKWDFFMVYPEKLRVQAEHQKIAWRKIRDLEQTGLRYADVSLPGLWNRGSLHGTARGTNGASFSQLRDRLKLLRCSLVRSNRSGVTP